MLIGCFNNLTAIAQHIRENKYHAIELIPAGLMKEHKPLLEDTHLADVLKIKLTTDKLSADQKLLTAHIESLKGLEKHPDHYWEDLKLAIQLDISNKVPLIQIEEPHLFKVTV